MLHNIIMNIDDLSDGNKRGGGGGRGDSDNQKTESMFTSNPDGGYDFYANPNDNNDGMKLPTVEEIMNLIEQMKDLNDDEREKLRTNILQQQAEVNKKLSQYTATTSPNLQAPDVVHTANDYLIFAAMIGLIITVFVLFGYKLYKSLIEKQRKREEKLKAKQSKKKK